MKYIEITASASSSDTISAIARRAKAHDLRLGHIDEDGLRQMRMLITDNQLQSVLDTLQQILGAQPTARIVVLSVETVLPQLDEERQEDENSATSSREAIYEAVAGNANLDSNYWVLVVLSTVVAAIGLIEDNVAVVIGAMVIARCWDPTSPSA